MLHLALISKHMQLHQWTLHFVVHPVQTDITDLHSVNRAALVISGHWILALNTKRCFGGQAMAAQKSSKSISEIRVESINDRVER